MKVDSSNPTNILEWEKNLLLLLILNFYRIVFFVHIPLLSIY